MVFYPIGWNITWRDHPRIFPRNLSLASSFINPNLDPITSSLSLSLWLNPWPPPTLTFSLKSRRRHLPPSLSLSSRGVAITFVVTIIAGVSGQVYIELLPLELKIVCSSMAALISKRLIRSLGSLHPAGRGSPNAGFVSFYRSHGIWSRISGERLFSAEHSGFLLARSMIQQFSTSMLRPDEGAFPSDLLSKKSLATSERTIGLCQDLLIPVTNLHNEDKGFMVLAGDVFDLPIRKDIIQRVVRWQLAKRQQGTHSTKTISEVSGTGRKPWKQKGTGRARHGSLRGPQFRGGATMHGPKPRSHAFKLNKKVRRLGLKIALSARVAEGKLLVFEDLEVPTHKTKNIVNYYNQMEGSKKVLLVDGGPIDEKLKLATQNLHYVNVLPSIGLNVYSILLHDTLVMSRDAVNRIVERMHTPINR